MILPLVMAAATLFIILPYASVRAQSFTTDAHEKFKSVQSPTLPKQPNSSLTVELNQLRTLLAKMPHDSALLNGVGVLHFELGEPEAAQHYLELAIRADEENPRALLNLAIVYGEMGQFAKALPKVRKVIAKNPRHAKARRYQCELKLTAADNDVAVKCFRAFLKDFGDEPDVQTSFGISLMRVGNYKEAIPVLRSVVSESHYELVAANALGVAYYQARMFSESADILKEAVERAPHNGQIRFNLALAYLALNNRSGALSQDRVLREQNSSFAKELHKILNRRFILDARTSSKRKR